MFEADGEHFHHRLLKLGINHRRAVMMLHGVGLLLATLGVGSLFLSNKQAAVLLLTIIAAGTSMPEVATSVMAAIRGERDIAVGNVIGSNTFNVLGCLGVSGLVSGQGLAIAPAVMNFDIWVMLAVAIACLPVFVAGREIGLVSLVGQVYGLIGQYYGHLGTAEDRRRARRARRVVLGEDDRAHELLVPERLVLEVAQIAHRLHLRIL